MDCRAHYSYIHSNNLPLEREKKKKKESGRTSCDRSRCRIGCSALDDQTVTYVQCGSILRIQLVAARGGKVYPPEKRQKFHELHTLRYSIGTMNARVAGGNSTVYTVLFPPNELETGAVVRGARVSLHRIGKRTWNGERREGPAGTRRGRTRLKDLTCQ